MTNLTPDNFKKELKALLKKYDAELYSPEYEPRLLLNIEGKYSIDLINFINGN